MNYLEKKQEKEQIKLKKLKKVLKNSKLIENIINLIVSKSSEDIKIEHYKKEIKQDRNKFEEKLLYQNPVFNFLFINENLEEEIVVSFELTYQRNSKEINYKFYRNEKEENLSLYSATRIYRKRMKFFIYIMDTIEEILFSENKKVKKYVDAFYQERKVNGFLFALNNLIYKKKLKEKEKFLKLFAKNIGYKELKEKMKKEKEFTLYYPSVKKFKDSEEILFITRTINEEVFKHLKNIDSKKAALLLRSLLTNVLVVNNKIITREKEIENLEFMKYLDKAEYGTSFIMKEEMKHYLNRCVIKEF